MGTIDFVAWNDVEYGLRQVVAQHVPVSTGEAIISELRQKLGAWNRVRSENDEAVAYDAYDVWLTHIGEKVIQTIKEVRACMVPFPTLQEAKSLVNDVRHNGRPWKLLTNVPMQQAVTVQEAFEEIGAKVRLDGLHPITRTDYENAGRGLMSIAQDLMKGV